jgi:hypothetical protein
LPPAAIVFDQIHSYESAEAGLHARHEEIDAVEPAVVQACCIDPMSDATLLLARPRAAAYFQRAPSMHDVGLATDSNLHRTTIRDSDLHGVAYNPQLNRLPPPTHGE